MRKIKIFAGMLLALTATACTQIDDNEIGLKRVYGELQDTPVKGLQFYNPWSTDVVSFDNQQQPVPSEATVPTHDQQRAHIKSITTVQLSPTSAAKMYRDVGQEWVASIVPQVVKSVQLEVFGKHTATNAIQQQEQVAQQIRNRLTDVLAKRGVKVTDYQLTEVKFSAEYMSAVETKATAVQKTEAAKNKTAEIQEQGRQQVIAAKAEADAMRERANALTANPKLIEYERLKVQSEAIAAWKEGGAKVPTTVMGGGHAGIPFINVPLGETK